MTSSRRLPRKVRVAWLFVKMWPVSAIGLPLWAVVLVVAMHTRDWWIIAAYSIVFGIAGIAEKERARKCGWNVNE